MDANQYPQYPQPSQPYPPQEYVVQENSPQTSPQFVHTTGHSVIVQVDGDEERIKKDTNYATILLVLGFFLNWLWLINFFLYRRSISDVARKYAKYSLIAFCVVLIISAVGAAVIIIANVVRAFARG
ncbi:gamma-secretase subunit PEN [Acrasis kona]|uniref:Gamma-secretase subunit PEN n=1 Tax=Acrasis kona TaxID=1008807 RepID=A0AAW2Z674_9EUKA